MSPHDYRGRLRQIVMQPTPFCNLDCDYCYLPFRHDKTLMSLDVARAAVCFARDNRLLGPSVEMRWHAGEPLAVPRTFYDPVLAVVNALLADAGVAVEHSIQTNGVLIDDAWAGFLARHGLRVGVSVDGPPHIHDAHRRTRRGTGTFEGVMRGIATLQRHGIPFDVIAVVTPETLADGESFRSFFANLPGLRSLGLNVEESEGAHRSGMFSAATRGTVGFEDAYRVFLGDLQEWSIRSGIVVRDFESMRALILHGAADTRNTQNEAFSILSVGACGDIATFSPELLGLTHPEAGGFVLGNLLVDSSADILASPRLSELDALIGRGRDRCRAGCDYYSLCGGGAPVNKLYENGSFDSMATRHCRFASQMVADQVLARIERDMAGP